MTDYIKEQLDKTEEDHDWTYKIKIVCIGTENKSKYLSINKNRWLRIKKILTEKGEN